MKVSYATQSWWVAASEAEGFSFGLGADGGVMLRLYKDLDTELIEDIKELNEDGPGEKWRAVRVKVEVIDP